MQHRAERLKVTDGDFEMEYFRFGSGKRAFVIIPGLSLKSVMNSADIVAYAYRDFAVEFTVYTFDIKKEIAQGITIRELADDTARAMNLLGIKNACVFGASMGGMITQYLALDYPELVEKIVLGSTCSRPNPAFSSIALQWEQFGKSHDNISINRNMFSMLFSEEFLKKNAAALPILENEGTPEECERLAVLAGACKGFDIYDRLPEIKCPALVIGSKNDKIMTEAAFTETAEKLGCELFIYDDYAHAVYDEAPDYKQRLMDFFTK